jgi:hypothetical protein
VTSADGADAPAVRLLSDGMEPDRPFPGPVAPMPDPSTQALLIFGDGVGAGASMGRPPRFVDGYEPFARYLRAEGADPSQLAADLSHLWLFVDGRSDILESPVMTNAAGRFVGNAIALAHPAATWRATPEPEVGTTAMSIPVDGIVRSMVANPERRQPFLEMFASWRDADADDREIAALRDARGGPDLVVPPAPFVRPPLPEPEFHDTEGRVIPYGSRWAGGLPPEESYSVVSHPERFAPMLSVVDALAEYLERWFVVDVARSQDDDGATILHFQPSTGAPLTIAASAESVRMKAGALVEEFVLSCTCDAFDETAASASDRLERLILAVAGGGLRERYPVGRRQWRFVSLRLPDGGAESSSGGLGPDVSEERKQSATATLQGLDNGQWPAWTPASQFEPMAGRADGARKPTMDGAQWRANDASRGHSSRVSVCTGRGALVSERPGPKCSRSRDFSASRSTRCS